VVRSEGSRSRAAFVAALALHLGAIVLVRRLPLELPAPPSTRSLDPALVWLEEAPAVPVAPAEDDLSPPAPGTGAGERVASSRTTGAPSPSGEASTFEPAEPPGVDLPPAEAPSTGTEPDAPGLTLEQLGIGERNPFLGDAAQRLRQKPRPGEGLRRSMADAIVRSEQGRGLGPEGPVLKELVEQTRRSDAALNASAVLRVATDASGHVLSVEVLESTSDGRPWRRVAAGLLEALRGQRLRVPSGGRGVTMDLRVVSRVELPSGADPGMGVDILGIPLKKPGGKKSPRISILKIDPKGYKVKLPDGKVLELPSVPLQSLLELAGDPVDLTGKAQRMVRAHVERLWANERSDEAPTASGSSSAPAPVDPPAPPAAKPN
jgi:hypothetical protein